ncbi:MAG: FecR family protein [Bacteroidales bacterium]|nr:FecR family protein [Bacteroidales bacterium]
MKTNKDLTKIDELLVSYLAGSADATERENVLTWIGSSPENKQYFEELRDVYISSKLSQSDSQYHVDTSLERIKARHYKNLVLDMEKADREKMRLFRLNLMKYAALVLLILSLGIVGFRYTRNKPVMASSEIWNTIEAPFGSRARLTLADGTKVWLNAGSQLKYSSRFAQHNRKVILNGEAYFDVAKDEKNQFIVSTSQLDIKVFGTQFNVKAYDEENTIQTTLVEGSVTIERKGIGGRGERTVTLNPNETATFFISGKEVDMQAKPIEKEDMQDKESRNSEKLEILSNINPVVFTSWKDSRWIIDSDPLSGLAVKLERRYNVKIIIDKKELREYKFSGTIKDETLEQVLNVIKLTAPINYSIHNNEVHLFENKSFSESYDEMLIKD